MLISEQRRGIKKLFCENASFFFKFYIKKKLKENFNINGKIVKKKYIIFLKKIFYYAYFKNFLSNETDFFQKERFAFKFFTKNKIFIIKKDKNFKYKKKTQNFIYRSDYKKTKNTLTFFVKSNNIKTFYHKMKKNKIFMSYNDIGNPTKELKVVNRSHSVFYNFKQIKYYNSCKRGILLFSKKLSDEKNYTEKVDRKISFFVINKIKYFFKKKWSILRANIF